MIVQLFRRTRLPSSARKSAGLIERGCKLALGKLAARPGQLNVIFTTNPEILDINRKYLGHDYFTDVIAFPYAAAGTRKRSADADSSAPFGDIYISVDQARIQAAGLGHSPFKEILTLAVHGTLHLVGYDDHAPADRKRMFVRQDEIVSRLLE